MLDIVLDWFNRNCLDDVPDSMKTFTREYAFQGITQEFARLKSGMFFNYFEVILNKLVKDGYIEHYFYPGDNEFNVKTGKVLPVPDTHRYRITFEGKFFIEHGGYTEAAGKKLARKRNRRIRNILVTAGAVAACIYFLQEIIKGLFE